MSRKAAPHEGYRPAEAKYKGGAEEIYVTYDIEQKTRGGGHALNAKVKRVYIAGHLLDCRLGSDWRNRMGRRVHGLRIDYERSRAGYRRAACTATRGGVACDAPPTRTAAAKQRFTRIVELPEKAVHVRFYRPNKRMPGKHMSAPQAVR